MSDSIRDRLKTEEILSAEPAGFAELDNRTAGNAAPAEPELPPSGRQLDPAEAKRAERNVAGLFLLAVVGTLGFIATFAFFPFEFEDEYYQFYTPLLGIFMTLALVGIGAGAVLWAKTLMVDEETIQMRHHLSSDPEDRAEAAAILKQGLQDTGLPRRKLLGASLALGGGALAILPVPLLFGLGPVKGQVKELEKTGWKPGSRLLDELGRPVKLGDLEIGAAKTVFPDVEGGRRMADSAAFIIRMRPDQLKVSNTRKNWVVDGHVVYSIICTHLGCPVKLYEQQTHHLFCPCHQSTFDAADGARALFGPAARALPQLAISLDEDGYFVARGDFNEPVGPSYWERDPSYKEPTYDATGN